MPEKLDDAAVAAALTDLPGWTRDGDALVLTITAPSFAAGIELVNRVADAAERADHHPDIEIHWTTVRFTCSTHSAGGLTGNDVALAAAISDAAARIGVSR